MYNFLQWMRRWACTLSEKQAKAWGVRLGRLFWYVMPAHRRRLAIENIIYAGVTEDPKEAERIAKESALRFGPMTLDMLRFPLYRDGKISRRVRLENTEFLDELEKSGQGCVLAASHSGNWEMLGAAIGQRYSRVVAVGFRQNSEGFDRFIRESRTMMGEKVVYPQNMREILRLLDDGAFVALLYDQDNRQGILAPLFDTMVLSVTGPAVISRSRKVPIVTVQVYEDGENYRGVIGDPVYTDQEKDKKTAIWEMTAHLNQVLQERILAQPKDWFWLHNRWKWTRRIYGEPKTLTRESKPLEQGGE